MSRVLPDIDLINCKTWKSPDKVQVSSARNVYETTSQPAVIVNINSGTGVCVDP
jgi:hypothetical protein